MWSGTLEAWSAPTRPRPPGVVYEFVLQEASTTEELGRYVNGEILAGVWSRLWLPRRVRESWGERFPELAHAA